MAFREKTAYDEIRPHPFITQCYGFFQDELSLYLLLELCVMDLFELLQLHADHKGRLSQPCTRFYIASVALALVRGLGLGLGLGAKSYTANPNPNRNPNPKP